MLLLLLLLLPVVGRLLLVADMAGPAAVAVDVVPAAENAQSAILQSFRGAWELPAAGRIVSVLAVLSTLLGDTIGGTLWIVTGVVMLLLLLLSPPPPPPCASPSSSCGCSRSLPLIAFAACSPNAGPNCVLLRLFQSSSPNLLLPPIPGLWLDYLHVALDAVICSLVYQG